MNIVTEIFLDNKHPKNCFFLLHELLLHKLLYNFIYTELNDLQVMAITHSMMELGCSKTETRDFLHGMCSLHELSERRRQDLLTHLLSR